MTLKRIATTRASFLFGRYRVPLQWSGMQQTGTSGLDEIAQSNYCGSPLSVGL